MSHSDEIFMDETGMDDALVDVAEDEAAGGTVALDTDGDGVIDQLVVDANGDGVADALLSDTNGDYALDTGFVDADLDGVMESSMRDVDGDAVPDVISGPNGVVADFDGDGVLETLLRDVNDDGIPDLSDLGAEALDIGEVDVFAAGAVIDPETGKLVAGADEFVVASVATSRRDDEEKGPLAGEDDGRGYNAAARP